MRSMHRARATNEKAAETKDANRRAGMALRQFSSSDPGRRFCRALSAIAVSLSLVLLASPAGAVSAGARSQQSPKNQQKSHSMQAQTQAADSGMPAANAKSFLHYIEKENSYKKWKLLPGTVRRQVGTSQAHGAFVTVYANQTAYNAARAMAPYPDGSILVKENYTKKFKLHSLTTMYRVKGYNPQGGGWYWVQASPNGDTVKKSGKIRGCMTCHRQAGSGWVFGGR